MGFYLRTWFAELIIDKRNEDYDTLNYLIDYLERDRNLITSRIEPQGWHPDYGSWRTYIRVWKKRTPFWRFLLGDY